MEEQTSELLRPVGSDIHPGLKGGAMLYLLKPLHLYLTLQVYHDSLSCLIVPCQPIFS